MTAARFFSIFFAGVLTVLWFGGFVWSVISVILNFTYGYWVEFTLTLVLVPVCLYGFLMACGMFFASLHAE